MIKQFYKKKMKGFNVQFSRLKSNKRWIEIVKQITKGSALAGILNKGTNAA